MNSPLRSPFGHSGFVPLCKWLLLLLSLSLMCVQTFAQADIVVKSGTEELADAVTINYNMVPVGTSSTRFFTLSNASTTTALINISFSKNGAHAADYTVNPPGVSALPPLGSTSFSITFQPSASFSRTAAVHIASNDPDENPFDINLTGIGIAPEISVSAQTTLTDGVSTVNFGKVRVGLSGTRQIVIRNLGNTTLSNLSLSLSGAGYSITTLPVTSLAQNATTQVTLSFTPSGTATSTGTLRIFSNDSDENPFDISLTGSGVIPLLDVESPPGSLLFDGSDNLVLNAPAGVTVQRQFVLRNVSTSFITGLALTLDGPGAADFSVSALPDTNLAPNATMPFTLSFTPSGAGSVNAALHIALDQSFGDPFDIALTGNTVSLPDEGDEDGDGMSNMLETAMGLDPLSPSAGPGVLVKNGDHLEFTIRRSIAAQAHTALSVEHSDDPAGIWTTVDISSAFLESDDGVVQQLRYIFPLGPDGRRFARIRATKL